MTRVVVPLFYPSPVALQPWAAAALGEVTGLSIGIEARQTGNSRPWTATLPVHAVDAAMAPLPMPSVGEAAIEALLRLAMHESPFDSAGAPHESNACWTQTVTSLWHPTSSSGRLAVPKGRLVVAERCAWIAPHNAAGLPPFGVFALEAENLLNKDGVALVEARAEALRREGNLARALCLPVATPATQSGHERLALGASVEPLLAAWATRDNQHRGETITLESPIW